MSINTGGNTGAEKKEWSSLLPEEYYRILQGLILKNSNSKPTRFSSDQKFADFEFMENKTGKKVLGISSDDIVALEPYGMNRQDLYVKTPEALGRLFEQLVLLGYEIHESYPVDTNDGKSEFARKNRWSTWSASLPEKNEVVIFNGKKYDSSPFLSQVPAPLSFNRIYETWHWDKEDLGYFEMSRNIISAAHLNDNPGYYYQDGRRVFGEGHIAVMTEYVRNFTHYDIAGWNSAMNRASRSGPGMIEAIREFCRANHDKPRKAEDVKVVRKIVSSKALSALEANDVEAIAKTNPSLYMEVMGILQQGNTRITQDNFHSEFAKVLNGKGIQIQESVPRKEIDTQKRNLVHTLISLRDWSNGIEIPEEFNDDKEIVLSAVKIRGDNLTSASLRLKGNSEIVLAAMKAKDGHKALQYASDEITDNKGFMLDAVQVDGQYLKYASVELCSDREIVLAAVRNDGSALKYASVELCSDREIVLAAVRQDGHALEGASEDLRGDRKIVLAAVENHGSAIEWVSEDLRGDREVVLTALRNKKSKDRSYREDNRKLLFYVNKELRKDREIVLAAVTGIGQALEYLPEGFESDKEIVLAAVQSDGKSLKYASKGLQEDREIVLAALKNSGDAFEFASEGLRGDKELVLLALSNRGKYFQPLEHASKQLCADRELIFTAVELDGFSLNYASENLRNDSEVVFAAINNSKYALKFASDELRDNLEFMMRAVTIDGDCLEYASENLKKNRSLVFAATSNNRHALYHASGYDFFRDRELVLIGVQGCKTVLNHASGFNDDREIVMEAVKFDGYALRYASERLRADREIAVAAIKSNAIAFQYVSKNLQYNPELQSLALSGPRRKD